MSIHASCKTISPHPTREPPFRSDNAPRPRGHSTHRQYGQQRPKRCTKPAVAPLWRAPCTTWPHQRPGCSSGSAAPRPRGSTRPLWLSTADERNYDSNSLMQTPPHSSNQKRIGLRTTDISTSTSSSSAASASRNADERSMLIPAGNTGTTNSQTVRHLADGDRTPLCGCSGTFDRVTPNRARTVTDYLCQNCETQQTGTQHTRPCPRCGTAVGVSAWPRHVRTCDGHLDRESSGGDL